MPKQLRAVPAILCVWWLVVACHGHPSDISADIGKVVDVKSSFGPDFQVKDLPTTGINPKLLASRDLPQGLTFEPTQCSKIAVGQQLPRDVQGNMAAVTAEGNGNRFITIALETSEPVPFTEPGRDCRKIGFSGGRMRGLEEVVEAPKIDGVHTLGIHRVIEAVAGGKARIGELYNYSAYFGSYQVLVTANPLVQPDQPVTPVDTARARDLLVAAVAAIRG